MNPFRRDTTMPSDEPQGVRPGDLRPGPIRRKQIDTALRWVLRPGPIRHKQIDDLLPALRWVYRHFKPYAGNTPFEQWELDFMRDKHPDAEVWLWVGMTYALLEFAHRNPALDRETIAAAVVALSSGQDHVVVEPAVVADELKRLMDNPPPELFDMGNFTPKGHFDSDREYLR